MSQTIAKTLTQELASPESDLLDQIVARTADIMQRTAAAHVQPMELRTFDELERWAQMAARSKMVPKGFDNPADIILAVQMGAELGLRPMQSLQNIAVINGRPSVWGDAMLALCKTHPLYVSTEETVSGEGESRAATCTMIRRGEPPVVRMFSVADAKKAGLWGKAGPWQQYPDRMMQMRARGFAARDAYPDKLKGLISREEASDIPLEAAGIVPTFTAPSAAPEPAPQRPSMPKFSTVADARAWCKEHDERWTGAIFLDALEAELVAAKTADAVDEIHSRLDVQKALDSMTNGALARLNAMIKAALDRTAAPAAEDDGWPADTGEMAV